VTLAVRNVDAGRRVASEIVATTGNTHVLVAPLNRHLDPDVVAALWAAAPYVETFDRSGVRYKATEQGAATSVLVATSPQLDGIGGRYLEDCNQARVLGPDAPNTTSSGVAACALDPEAAVRVWDVSLETLAS
jgi:hypothetical protein